MFFRVFVRHFANDRFGLARSFIGFYKRRVFRQPYVYVREIGKVFRKELLFKLAEQHCAQSEKDQRRQQSAPAMLNRLSADAIVQRRKAALASFFDRYFPFGLEQIITEQRDEGH